MNSINIQCDNCNQPFTALSGEKWECPKCGVVKEVVAVTKEGQLNLQVDPRKEAK